VWEVGGAGRPANSTHARHDLIRLIKILHYVTPLETRVCRNGLPSGRVVDLLMPTPKVSLFNLRQGIILACSPNQFCAVDKAKCAVQDAKVCRPQKKNH